MARGVPGHLPRQGRELPAAAAPGLALDQIGERIAGWKARVTQLAPGPGRGRVCETLHPGARIVHLEVDTPAALEAFPLAARAEELFHVGTLAAPDRVRWQGALVRPDALLLETGAVPSSFAFPPGCELLVARLDRARIERLASVLRGPDAMGGTPRTQLRPQSLAALVALRALLRLLAGGGLAGRGDQAAAAVAELYERVGVMLAAPPLPVHLTPQTRRRALRSAEEYMDAHVGEHVSLVELCAVSQCSERTLRRVFLECYGVTPMNFLKRVRLQGLRRELRDANGAADTVLRLAMRWGFWHMGHLARDYRQLFGETPRETRARGR